MGAWGHFAHNHVFYELLICWNIQWTIGYTAMIELLLVWLGYLSHVSPIEKKRTLLVDLLYHCQVPRVKFIRVYLTVMLENAG